MAVQLSAETLLKILNTLPLLATDVANGIRSLLESRGYDIDKLLSSGVVLNEQTLTHVNNEISRVEALIKANALSAAPAALAPKGGDPLSPSVKTPAEKEPAKTSIKK